MYSNPFFKLSTLLEIIADIAAVIIACVNLLLAGYIFLYQQKKDRDSALESQIQLEQNIRLRWFRELIIQPNIKDVDQFYEDLHDLAIKFRELNEKEETYKIIKAKAAMLRRNFVELIRKIDQQLYDKILLDLDDLIDSLGNTVYDTGINLTEESLYNSNVSFKITDWYQSFIATIYQYKAM